MKQHLDFMDFMHLGMLYLQTLKRLQCFKMVLQEA